MMISIGAFAWGYWQVGFESLARWVVAFGVFWIVAQWQRWRWVSSVWTVSAVLLAIFGLWFNLNLGWMFSGALFALFAWDLTEFRRKLKQLSPRDDARGMERRHILRIGFLSAGGILIALLLDRLW
ncbi:MAG: hypothetical protein KJZ77_15005 [Anaerolineales bacterium]|nr:hypothetical protein [Anaerolineales bacterium]